MKSDKESRFRSSRSCRRSTRNVVVVEDDVDDEEDGRAFAAPVAAALVVKKDPLTIAAATATATTTTTTATTIPTMAAAAAPFNTSSVFEDKRRARALKKEAVARVLRSACKVAAYDNVYTKKPIVRRRLIEKYSSARYNFNTKLICCSSKALNKRRKRWKTSTTATAVGTNEGISRIDHDTVTAEDSELAEVTKSSGGRRYPTRRSSACESPFRPPPLLSPSLPPSLSPPFSPTAVLSEPPPLRPISPEPTSPISRQYPPLLRRAFVVDEPPPPSLISPRSPSPAPSYPLPLPTSSKPFSKILSPLPLRRSRAASLPDTNAEVCKALDDNDGREDEVYDDYEEATKADDSFASDTSQTMEEAIAAAAAAAATVFEQDDDDFECDYAHNDSIRASTPISADECGDSRNDASAKNDENGATAVVVAENNGSSIRSSEERSAVDAALKETPVHDHLHGGEKEEVVDEGDKNHHGSSESEDHFDEHENDEDSHNRSDKEDYNEAPLDEHKKDNVDNDRIHSDNEAHLDEHKNDNADDNHIFSENETPLDEHKDEDDGDSDHNRFDNDAPLDERKNDDDNDDGLQNCSSKEASLDEHRNDDVDNDDGLQNCSSNEASLDEHRNDDDDDDGLHNRSDNEAPVNEHRNDNDDDDDDVLQHNYSDDNGDLLDESENGHEHSREKSNSDEKPEVEQQQEENSCKAETISPKTLVTKWKIVPSDIYDYLSERCKPVAATAVGECSKIGRRVRRKRRKSKPIVIKKTPCKVKLIENYEDATRVCDPYLQALDDSQSQPQLESEHEDERQPKKERDETQANTTTGSAGCDDKRSLEGNVGMILHLGVNRPLFPLVYRNIVTLNGDADTEITNLWANFALSTLVTDPADRKKITSVFLPVKDTRLLSVIDEYKNKLSVEFKEIELSKMAAPVRTTSVASVRTTRVAPVLVTEPKPVTTTEVAPVPTTEVAPVPTTEPESVRTTEMKPVRTKEMKPVRTTEAKPVPTTKAEPVRTTEAEPVRITEATDLSLSSIKKEGDVDVSVPVPIANLDISSEPTKRMVMRPRKKRRKWRKYSSWSTVQKTKKPSQPPKKVGRPVGRPRLQKPENAIETTTPTRTRRKRRRVATAATVNGDSSRENFVENLRSDRIKNRLKKRADGGGRTNCLDWRHMFAESSDTDDEFQKEIEVESDEALLRRHGYKPCYVLLPKLNYSRDENGRIVVEKNGDEVSATATRSPRVKQEKLPSWSPSSSHWTPAFEATAGAKIKFEDEPVAFDDVRRLPATPIPPLVVATPATAAVAAPASNEWSSHERHFFGYEHCSRTYGPMFDYVTRNRSLVFFYKIKRILKFQNQNNKLFKSCCYFRVHNSVDSTDQDGSCNSDEPLVDVTTFSPVSYLNSFDNSPVKTAPDTEGGRGALIAAASQEDKQQQHEDGKSESESGRAKSSGSGGCSWSYNPLDILKSWKISRLEGPVFKDFESNTNKFSIGFVENSSLRIKGDVKWFILRLNRSLTTLIYGHTRVLPVELLHQVVYRADLTKKVVCNVIDEDEAAVAGAPNDDDPLKFGVYGVPGFCEAVLLGPYPVGQRQHSLTAVVKLPNDEITEAGVLEFSMGSSFFFESNESRVNNICGTWWQPNAADAAASTSASSTALAGGDLNTAFLNFLFNPHLHHAPNAPPPPRFDDKIKIMNLLLEHDCFTYQKYDIKGKEANFVLIHNGADSAAPLTDTIPISDKVADTIPAVTAVSSSLGSSSSAATYPSQNNAESNVKSSVNSTKKGKNALAVQLPVKKSMRNRKQKFDYYEVIKMHLPSLGRCKSSQKKPANKTRTISKETQSRPLPPSTAALPSSLLPPLPSPSENYRHLMDERIGKEKGRKKGSSKHSDDFHSMLNETKSSDDESLIAVLNKAVHVIKMMKETDVALSRKKIRLNHIRGMLLQKYAGCLGQLNVNDPMFKEGMRFISQLKVPAHAELFERDYQRRMAKQKLLDEEKAKDPLYMVEMESLVQCNALWNQCNGVLREEMQKRAASQQKRQWKRAKRNKTVQFEGYGDDDLDDFDRNFKYNYDDYDYDYASHQGDLKPAVPVTAATTTGLGGLEKIEIKDVRSIKPTADNEESNLSGGSPSSSPPEELLFEHSYCNRSEEAEAAGLDSSMVDSKLWFKAMSDKTTSDKITSDKTTSGKATPNKSDVSKDDVWSPAAFLSKDLFTTRTGNDKKTNTAATATTKTSISTTGTSASGTVASTTPSADTADGKPMQYGFMRIQGCESGGAGSAQSNSTTTATATTATASSDRVSVFLTENNKPITKLVIEKLKSANNDARHLPPPERREQIIALIRKILHEVVQRSGHKSQGVPTEERILIPRLHLLQRMLQGQNQVQPTATPAKPPRVVLGEAIEISDDEENDEFTIEPAADDAVVATATAATDGESVAERKLEKKTVADKSAAGVKWRSINARKPACNNRIYVKVTSSSAETITDERLPPSSPPPAISSCDNAVDTGCQIVAQNDTVIEHQIDNQIILDESPLPPPVSIAEDSTIARLLSSSPPLRVLSGDASTKSTTTSSPSPSLFSNEQLDTPISDGGSACETPAFTPVFVDANQPEDDLLPSSLPLPPPPSSPAASVVKREEGLSLSDTKLVHCQETSPFHMPVTSERRTIRCLPKKKSGKAKKKSVAAEARQAVHAAAVAAAAAGAFRFPTFPILPNWSNAMSFPTSRRMPTLPCCMTATAAARSAPLFWNRSNNAGPGSTAHMSSLSALLQQPCPPLLDERSSLSPGNWPSLRHQPVKVRSPKKRKKQHQQQKKSSTAKPPAQLDGCGGKVIVLSTDKDDEPMPVKMGEAAAAANSDREERHTLSASPSPPVALTLPFPSLAQVLRPRLDRIFDSYLEDSSCNSSSSSSAGGSNKTSNNDSNSSLQQPATSSIAGKCLASKISDCTVGSEPVQRDSDSSTPPSSSSPSFSQDATNSGSNNNNIDDDNSSSSSSNKPNANDGDGLRLSVKSFASINSFKTKCFTNMDKLLNC